MTQPIDRETAIALAKEAGMAGMLTDVVCSLEEIHRLCNLAVAHSRKDAEPVEYQYPYISGGEEMTTNKCAICGELMPEGETMFKFHGYSGPCPKPPLKKVELDPAGVPKQELTVIESQAIKVLNSLAALPDEVLAQIPVSIRMNIDVVLAMATVRRIGVK